MLNHWEYSLHSNSTVKVKGPYRSPIDLTVEWSSSLDGNATRLQEVNPLFFQPGQVR